VLPTKTFHVCSSFDAPPPPTGPIQLGYIIKSIDDPYSALNSGEYIEPDHVHRTWKSNFKASSSQIQKCKFGLWSELLQLTGLGGSLNLSHNREAEYIYVFDRVETSFFVPSDEYYMESLSLPSIQRYLKNRRYRSPVYIITGMKVVRGAKVEMIESKGKEAGEKIGFNRTLAGVPITIGPEAKVTSKIAKLNSFDGSSDFVFAIKVRKLTLKRDGTIKHRQVTKGAMFGIEREEPAQDPLEGLSLQVDDEELCLDDIQNIDDVAHEE
jgi:hypothetical protein